MRNLMVGLVCLTIAAAGPAAAVDSATFKCESKQAAAGAKFGAARGGCLAKCWNAEAVAGGNDPARNCRPADCPLGSGVFDAVTQACIDKAEAKYLAAYQKACPAGTFPNCGPYTDCFGDPTPPDCEVANNLDYTNGNSIVFQVDCVGAPSEFCDLTAAAASCQLKATGALGKLARGVTKCFSKCYAALQLKGDATRDCAPAGLDGDGLDLVTQGCIDAVKAKITAKIAAACPTPPTCGLWVLGDLPGWVIDTLVNLSYGTADQPYCAP
jgi:hypothetical protein